MACFPQGHPYRNLGYAQRDLGFNLTEWGYLRFRKQILAVASTDLNNAPRHLLHSDPQYPQPGILPVDVGAIWPDAPAHAGMKRSNAAPIGG
jgi:hypothetical protein